MRGYTSISVFTALTNKLATSLDIFMQKRGGGKTKTFYFTFFAQIKFHKQTLLN